MARRTGSKRRKKDTEDTSHTVSVEWEGLDELPVLFANNILVQATGQEFIITFSQLVPPVTFGLDIAEIKKIDLVTARGAVRVGLSPSRMQEFIDVLTRNFNRFLASVEEEAGKKGGS